MNDFRPSLGIEFDDKYKNAKNKLFDCYAAISKLTETQRHQLAIEFLKSFGMTAALKQFMNDIKNGGRF